MEWTGPGDFRTWCDLESKREISEEVTQAGDVKVNGRLTTLDRLAAMPSVVRRVPQQMKRHHQGAIGWPTLAKELGKVLKPSISHQTARHMKAEIEMKNL